MGAINRGNCHKNRRVFLIAYINIFCIEILQPAEKMVPDLVLGSVMGCEDNTMVEEHMGNIYQDVTGKANCQIR